MPVLSPDAKRLRIRGVCGKFAADSWSFPFFRRCRSAKTCPRTAVPRALIPRGNFIHGIDHEDLDRRFARFELQPHILLNRLEHGGALAVVPG
jgi:hypothetical protein